MSIWYDKHQKQPNSIPCSLLSLIITIHVLKHTTPSLHRAGGWGGGERKGKKPSNLQTFAKNERAK